MRKPQNVEWLWRSLLTGSIMFYGPRRIFRLIPATQRCKNCLAPLQGRGVALMRLLGRGPFQRNPRFCNF
jgi:hypothetical protein